MSVFMGAASAGPSLVNLMGAGGQQRASVPGPPGWRSGLRETSRRRLAVGYGGPAERSAASVPGHTSRHTRQLDARGKSAAGCRALLPVNINVSFKDQVKRWPASNAERLHAIPGMRVGLPTRLPRNTVLMNYIPSVQPRGRDLQEGLRYGQSIAGVPPGGVGVVDLPGDRRQAGRSSNSPG